MGSEDCLKCARFHQVQMRILAGYNDDHCMIAKKSKQTKITKTKQKTNLLSNPSSFVKWHRLF